MSEIITNNKKAFHEYFIEETFEAGIVLVGSEVKSIRSNGISLNESFVNLKNNELFLKNAYIKPFEMASSFVPDAHRDRKLLLNREEIKKIFRKTREKGYTIVPTKVYFKNNLVKIEVALAKGKKLYDKKETLKEKSQAREVQQAIKSFNQFK